MRNLFIVTHTESLHHVQNRVGGWYDTALTDKGCEDARRTAERLRTLVPDGEVELFSSDLLRAAQTAEAIAERFAVETTLLPDLREISYGVAEGQPQEWLDARQIPPPHTNRLDHRGGVENGETKREFATRLYRALDTILEHPCPTQIIVTHGFAQTFVIAAWARLPIESIGYLAFRPHPGGITHLREDDYWQNRGVIFLNDTTHLAPLAD